MCAVHRKEGGGVVKWSASVLCAAGDCVLVFVGGEGMGQPSREACVCIMTRGSKSTGIYAN